MTDRDDLADRLDAVEEELGAGDARPLIVLDDGDGYVTLDGEPAPEGGEALIALPPEVTEFWEWTDDDDAQGDA
ncbi:hypothetical protein PM033_17510 [Halorubrum ezzemoulense]|uniref:hypothetical protein n=1 Tax=Halorubrum ezzemoulense TaxID=337243 RepID=UPI00233089B6|nr:hypothetical protein [Halorubrum ezzemoulense]MDB2253521.1 hypothetical protein [Halorubrum ezzemoulense]